MCCALNDLARHCPPERASDRDRTGLRRALFLAFLAAPLAGCGKVSILNAAGPIGADNRTILLNSLAIMLCIVVPTIVAALVFAWWFRASNTKAVYRPTFTYSGRIELVVWTIPLLTILFLGGLIWIGSHRLDPMRPLQVENGPETLEVQVVSLDWKWLFIYPGQTIATVNHLTVPTGTPVRFRLTSASVFNVFFVPELGSMIYAMNRMETRLHLRADHDGAYYGRSAQFSGDGFPGMNFTLHAVPQAAFDEWVAETKTGDRALDEAAYRDLSQRTSDVPPFSYASAKPGLFEAILHHRLPPQRGPSEGSGGPEVSPEVRPSASLEPRSDPFQPRIR